MASFEWSEVRDSWQSYRETVDAWLEIAEEAGEELDERIHSLIHAHNKWSDDLGNVLHETHHH